MENKDFSLRTILENVTGMLTPKARSKGFELGYVMDEDLPPCSAATPDGCARCLRTSRGMP